MNPIQVAIVGCVRISDLHELGYRGRDDARIVAVCGTKRKNVRVKAKAWGIEKDKAYTDYQKPLAGSEIDLVELLVPHHLHAEMTVAACEVGKHVSVQKPRALTAWIQDTMWSIISQRIITTQQTYASLSRLAQLANPGTALIDKSIPLRYNAGDIV